MELLKEDITENTSTMLIIVLPKTEKVLVHAILLKLSLIDVILGKIIPGKVARMKQKLKMMEILQPLHPHHLRMINDLKISDFFFFYFVIFLFVIVCNF